jgi:acyl carrier protein
MKEFLQSIQSHLELHKSITPSEVVMDHDEMDSLMAVDLEVFLEDEYHLELQNSSELLQKITWEQLYDLTVSK